MVDQGAITAVGNAIQLSVAPVFLLSAIGAMLSVMTNRLSRIVDRGRQVESRLPMATPDESKAYRDELRILLVRARLVNRAITLCTVTALFVCAMVSTLFFGAFFGWQLAIPLAGLFVCGMLAFFAGLLYFLREIFVATASFRMGPH